MYIFASTLGLILLVCKSNGLIGLNIRQVEETEFKNVVNFVQFENQHTRENEELLCTGTLISRDLVLSSEHCFQPLLYVYVEIILRVRRGNQYGRRFMAWWLSFNQWAVETSSHMEYDENDIAVVKLNKVVPQTISPAVISYISCNELYQKTVTIAGYGSLNITTIPVLTKANVKIMTNVNCNNFVLLMQNIPMEIPDIILCSKSNPYALIVKGDSGGPVIYQNSLVAVNYGICPNLDQNLNNYRVNLHVGLAYYRQFIEFTLTIP